MKLRILFSILIACAGLARAADQPVEVASLRELVRVAAQSGHSVRMQPGVYRLAEYLSDEVIAGIAKNIDRSKEGRPPVPMIAFTGSDNRFDFRDAVFEIDTAIYPKMPTGYLRCILLAGNRNTVTGLTVRNTGADRGSNGNIFSTLGDDNTIEGVTLHVFGSFPHGYGDLLGKGGPNIVNPLLKQSGFMTGGNRNTLRGCRVFSRAFGHCFYIQKATGTRIEDCYAEGEMRPTSDMLRDTSGPAFDLGFRSVYANRDGRYLITPGYMKALGEDGFRTYGGVSQTTIVNCVAVNTRAGFEIGGSDEDGDKTVVENCVARGCERGFLIGSQTIVRRGRADIAHGPMLYLRGGKNSDVEIELVGDGPQSLVHAVATIAGTNHRVRLTAQPGERTIPALPILLGFGMPEHAEMSSPIKPAPARGVTLANEIAAAPVITGDISADCKIETKSRTFTDAELQALPSGARGSWNLPPSGIAPGGPAATPSASPQRTASPLRKR